MIQLTGPIEFSYQVFDNLYAGEYPGQYEEAQTIKKIEKFRRFGITDFIDLTKDPHLKPYESYLSNGMKRHSFPIPDQSVPADFTLIDQIFDTIENLRASDHKVYVHCWGGVGRTGTVVACWLGRYYKLTGQNALDQLQLLWQTCPKSKVVPYTPENLHQRSFVERYLESRK